MSQQVLTFAGSPLSGTAMIAALETKLQSLASSRSGTSRPSDIVAGEEWLDTTTATAWLVKRWDGVDDITIMTINTTANTVTFTGTATSGANSNITSLSGLTTPLSVAQGGTASATAADARTALGLAIGTDVQAYDADTMKSDVVTARTRAHRFTPVAVTAAGGGALAIDCDLHEACSITLAETTTTVGEASNQAADKYVVIQITGATGKALAWNTNWQKDGSACIIDAPANGVVDLHCFRSSGTEMIHIGSKLAV